MQSTIAFGYTCQECGVGTVIEQVFPAYPTKIKGYPFTVKDALIGVCDQCGAEHFAVQETNRWEELFETAHAKHYLQPKEIRELPHILGVTIEQFAMLLGCTRQSLHNWLRPERRKPQSRMADVLMKLVRESRAQGKVDVLQFLTQEARRFGIEIDLGTSNGSSDKSLMRLRALTKPATALEARATESVQLAADTEEEEYVIALEAESGDLIGKLSYDYPSASLNIEFKVTLDFNQFDAMIRFKDEAIEHAKAVTIKDRRSCLLTKTGRTDRDVQDIILTPKN